MTFPGTIQAKKLHALLLQLLSTCELLGKFERGNFPLPWFYLILTEFRGFI